MLFFSAVDELWRDVYILNRQRAASNTQHH